MQPNPNPSPTRRPLLRAVALTAGVLAGALALVGNPQPAQAADGPSITGRGCAPGTGVTVVVDARELRDDVRIGCAPGAQPSGLAALEAAGFATNTDAGAPAGALCQIDRLPAEGYPTCWYDGYWSSWRSDGTAAWSFATTGPTTPLAVGAVEGWTWDGPGGGAAGAPRLAIAELGDHLLDPPDCTAAPDAPTFDLIDDDEDLPVALADGHPVEVAIVEPGTPIEDATWARADVIDLNGRSGPTRVLARRAGPLCPQGPTFDATYDVRAAYGPRWSSDGPGSPSPAIDKADPALVAFATGYERYEVGANVSPTYQVPANALGPIDGSLVVLGDRGSITLTFDSPVADDAGADLAVFENGFAYGADDYLELARIEVSSDGETFARFDSASRRATPVGAFVAQSPAELGGLAGKDLAGKGTPFDLAVLRNDALVRSGAVDLGAITHVRILDVVGDGSELDSFGRPIYDPYPVTGSAGFDLAGVGVLHEADLDAPVVAITSAPTGAVDADRAEVSFEVDDPTATVTARLDGGEWAPATSPLVLEGLAQGERTVEVRAVDAAGNAGSASATWTVAVTDPLSADGSWAMAATTDLLGVPADATERAAIESRLGRGTARRTVAGELVRSEAWTRAVAGEAYRTALGREADPSGAAYWARQLASGARRPEALLAELLASPERYRRSGGTDAAWVGALYRDVLGREADPAGLAHWTSRTGALGRQRVAAAIVASPESRRDRVRSLYAELLGRAADPSGLAHWSGRIGREGDLALAVHLVSSDEYGRRAVVRFPRVLRGS